MLGSFLYLECLSSLALVVPIFAAPYDASCMNNIVVFCMHALLLSALAFCFMSHLEPANTIEPCMMFVEVFGIAAKYNV